MQKIHKDKGEVLRVIREKQPELTGRFTVRRIGVFGSFARGGAEQFVSRHQRAAFGKAFQCSDLLFQAQDKSGCRIGFVLGHVLPDFGHIRFSGLGYVNPGFSWHA